MQPNDRVERRTTVAQPCCYFVRSNDELGSHISMMTPMPVMPPIAARTANPIGDTSRGTVVANTPHPTRMVRNARFLDAGGAFEKNQSQNPTRPRIPAALAIRGKN